MPARIAIVLATVTLVFGVAGEGGQPVLFAMRLRVVDRKVTERGRGDSRNAADRRAIGLGQVRSA